MTKFTDIMFMPCYGEYTILPFMDVLSLQQLRRTCKIFSIWMKIIENMIKICEHPYTMCGFRGLSYQKHFTARNDTEMTVKLLPGLHDRIDRTLENIFDRTASSLFFANLSPFRSDPREWSSSFNSPCYRVDLTKHEYTILIEMYKEYVHSRRAIANLLNYYYLHDGSSIPILETYFHDGFSLFLAVCEDYRLLLKLSILHRHCLWAFVRDTICRLNGNDTVRTLDSFRFLTPMVHKVIRDRLILSPSSTLIIDSVWWLHFTHSLWSAFHSIDELKTSIPMDPFDLLRRYPPYMSTTIENVFRVIDCYVQKKFYIVDWSDQKSLDVYSNYWKTDVYDNYLANAFISPTHYLTQSPFKFLLYPEFTYPFQLTYGLPENPITIFNRGVESNIGIIQNTFAGVDTRMCIESMPDLKKIRINDFATLDAFNGAGLIHPLLRQKFYVYLHGKLFRKFLKGKTAIRNYYAYLMRLATSICIIKPLDIAAHFTGTYDIQMVFYTLLHSHSKYIFKLRSFPTDRAKRVFKSVAYHKHYVNGAFLYWPDVDGILPSDLIIPDYHPLIPYLHMDRPHIIPIST